jgi:hypothetical protein
VEEKNGGQNPADKSGYRNTAADEERRADLLNTLRTESE